MFKAVSSVSSVKITVRVRFSFLKIHENSKSNSILHSSMAGDSFTLQRPVFSTETAFYF